MTKVEIDKLKEQFGEHLQKIRESKNLSLLKLSYNCSIDESNISKIEQGKRNVTIATIFELAKGLDVHPKKLLDFTFDVDK